MYRVTSAFILKRTGRRIEPGEMFEPESEQQAARLIAAGCLEPVPVLTAPQTHGEDEPETSDELPAEDRPTRRGRRRNNGD